MHHGERMARFLQTDLYVVITERYCEGRSPLKVLHDVLSAGVRTVQLREKEMDDRELYDRALLFREATRRAGALLIVNDRPDVALASGADGVHLGQRDLPVGAARGIASELIIGVSTHTPEETLNAQDAGASYVNIGPIFPTATKETAMGAIGPEAIARIDSKLTIPFTVMGGIKISNIEEVLRYRVRHVAVVTAVTAAHNIESAAKELREAIGRYQPHPHFSE